MNHITTLASVDSNPLVIDCQRSIIKVRPTSLSKCTGYLPFMAPGELKGAAILRIWVALCNSDLWDAGSGCPFLLFRGGRQTTNMTTPNFSTYLSKLWVVPVSIALALLIFQSIWLAYGLGLFIVAMKASAETRKRVEQLTESHESFDGLQGKAKLGEATGITFQWLLAYTALFVFVVIPVVYNIHTKTDIKLLSRDAERYIESIIDDGNEPACYMGAC